ncbi:MAG: PHP domain-containing protein [Mycoplasmoidaceae bacterium]
MNKNNYHTHTRYCDHSTNDVEQIILLAIKEGYQTLGFSEHCPLRGQKRIPDEKDLLKLIAEVNTFKEKYKDQIKIYMGLEAEYHPDEKAYFQMLRNLPGIDYMIFGNHYHGNCLKKLMPIEETEPLTMMKSHYENMHAALSSNLFSCYAHPDIFVTCYQNWDEKTIELTKAVIAASIVNDVPLEFNLNGLEMKLNKAKSSGKEAAYYLYPTEPFWREVAKSNAKVIIGVDTHHYETIKKDLLLIAYDLIEKWGIKKNMIDRLELK